MTVKFRPGLLMRSARPLFRAAISQGGIALIFALGCVIAGAALSAAAPLTLAWLVDSLTDKEAPAGLLLGLYVASLGLARCAAEGRSFFFGVAEQDILRDLSLAAVRHTLSLPLEFLQARSPGTLVQFLENGLQGYRLLLQHGVFTVLPGFLEIALMVVILASVLDAAFLAVFGACAVMYGVLFTGGAVRVMRTSRDVSAARIGVTAHLADCFQNIETVKALSGEASVSGQLDRLLHEVRQAWRRFFTVRGRNGLLVALVFSLSLAPALSMGMGRVGSGAMTTGEFVLVSAYMLQVIRPMEMLGYAARDVGQGVAFIERLAEILAESPEAGSGEGTLPEGKEGLAVRLDAVSYGPADRTPVLQDISLDIRPGMRVGLVGASGSGKSTLLRLMTGLLTTREGTIRIDGAPIASLNLSDLRRQVAFIPQQPGLFRGCVQSNLSFPDAEIREAVIEEMLCRLGLRGLSGFSSCASLSGGERQRISIGRALLAFPRLVLADEPTSALDAETEAVILEELDTAFAGITLILATHRLRAVRHMDLIVVMSEGRVAETGTHDVLVRAGGTYAAMWEAQEASGK
jgi:ABC-type multidrug transport system fused ATPase/permease subunit